MIKNLFVGGPWHGRLIEGVLTTSHTWRVPVPPPMAFALWFADGYDTAPREVLYDRRRLIIAAPGDSRADISIWVSEDGRNPLLVAHAMATALGMSIVEER